MAGDQGFIQTLVSGGSMKFSGGTIEWPEATSRGAQRRVREGSGERVSQSPVWGSRGVTPGKILKLEA